MNHSPNQSARDTGSQPIAIRVIALCAVLFVLGVAVGSAIANSPVKSRIALDGDFRRLLMLVLGPQTVDLYVGVLALPLFIWAARRWPVLRPISWRGVIAQVLLIIGVSAVSIGILFSVFRFGAGARVVPAFFALFRAGATVPVIIGVAILAQAVELRTREHRKALEAEQLRVRLADARLQTLTAQLRPHFLFNTLQNVSTLIHRTPAAADALLSHLSELLRASFRYADARTIALHEELRLVSDYMEIARVRFGDRLSFEVKVEGDAANAAVPPFLLQPIIENAIEHGFDDGAPDVRIALRAYIASDMLWIAVTDSGRGVGSEGSNGSGIGLRNTRERLTQTFGDSASLALRSVPAGGTVVDLRMPVRAPQPAGE